MKKLLILLTSVSLCATPIIIYDTNTLRVTQYIPRGQTPKFEGRQDVIVVAPVTETNIHLVKIQSLPEGFVSEPQNYRVAQGTNLTRVSQATIDFELAAQAAALSAYIESNLRNEAKAYVTNLGPLDLRIRAADLVLLQRINRIGSSNGVPAMTPIQFRNAVQATIDDKSAD